jgi:trimeric autotransporter adhesin
MKRSAVQSSERKARSEAGDTLIEVLIAILVLGAASVTLLIAFGTSLSGSTQHRAMATVDTVLRTAAEQATTQLQQQSSTLWQNCSGAGPSGTTGAISFSLPTGGNGYTAAVTSVQYWSSTSSTFGSASTWNSSTSAYSPCVPNAPQLLQITVTSTLNSAQSTISLVVDDPQARPVPTPGAATQLVFIGQPGDGTSGSNLSPQPIVAVEDASGNIVTSNLTPTTLAISSGSGGSQSSGATISSTCSGSDFYGVVTFSNCSVTKAGTFSLTASGGSLTPATSSNFTVTAGTPSQLAFTTQPSDPDAAGIAFSTQPAVTVEDAAGNAVATDASTVSLAFTPQTGTSGAILAGCSQSESLGVVTFAGCSTTSTGVGYTLTATDGSMTAVSNTFAVTAGTPAELIITTQPSSTATGGTAFATQPVVAVEDAYGNIATTDTSAVTLAITAGTGTTGAAISCTSPNPLNVAGGIATFTGCSINKKATTAYTLKATDGSLTSATSSGITVSVGSASQLAFTTQPSSGVNESTHLGTPVVAVEDNGGNTVTTDTGNVTISIGSYAAANGGSNQGALGCSNMTVSAVAGLASFTNCQITGTAAAGTYTFNAGRTGLTTGTSSNVSITAANPTKALITPSTSSTTASNKTTVTLNIQLQDGNSNSATSPAGTTTTLNLTTPSAQDFFATATNTSGTLGGSINATFAPGAGTATVYYGDEKAETQTITATNTTTTTTWGTTSVSAVAGTASQVAITPNPATVIASNTTNTTLGLQLQDQFGNNTTSSGTTTLVLSTPGASDFFATSINATGNFSTTMTATFAPGGGTATTYYGDEKAETPVFTAKNGGVTWATTSPLTVVPGVAVGLSFANAHIGSSTATTVTCTGTVATASYSCTLSPSSGFNTNLSVTAMVDAVDQFGNPAPNPYGQDVAISLSQTGGSLSTNSVTIKAGGTYSTTSFTETLPGNSNAAAVVTASVQGASIQAIITDR